MNIRDVAKRAGVSTATVSRTINGAPTVKPHLARRVWGAIEELGFYPDTQARGLVSGRSRIFGLIISEITNPFFPEIVQGFEDLAVQHNYEMLMSSTLHDPKRMALSVRRMIERQVEGVAVLSFGMEEALLEILSHVESRWFSLTLGPRCREYRISELTTCMASGKQYSIWRPCDTNTSLLFLVHSR